MVFSQYDAGAAKRVCFNNIRPGDLVSARGIRCAIAPSIVCPLFFGLTVLGWWAGEGRITLVNRYACSVLGWTADELLGRDWFETCLPARIRRAVEKTFRNLLGGDRSIVESPVLTRSGEERLIEWRHTVLRDDAGQVIGTFSSGADITQRNQVVEALQTATKRLRFALDAANMGTWDWDVRTQSVRWSDNVERIHGLPPGSFDGTFQSYEREIHSEDRERVLASIQRALSEGVPHEVEYRIVGPDGTVRWVEGKGRVEHGPDGRPRRMTGVCMNVTPRKHAELARVEALEQSNRASQRLAAIVESSDDAILSKSLEGVITSWNRAAERLFGYSASEAIGQSITLIVPPDRRAEEDLMLARIRAGEPVEMETVRQHKDGTSVAISLMVSPVKDADGHIVGASKIARDITERKKAEAALRRLSGRLLRLEDEERRRLSRELHDSTAQRLAALCMNLSVANEAAGALDQRAQRALAESVALADECLREIRTVSYLLHPPELDELGLQSALARYIDGFVQRSGIRVETEVSPDLGRLPQAVETTVFRIVQECLTNIHRHSGSSTARIRLRRGPSDLVLEVQDAGTGLRGNAPPGVGIASMQERLQQFGGSLEISSQPGGTNVKAVIPLSRVAA